MRVEEHGVLADDAAADEVVVRRPAHDARAGEVAQIVQLRVQRRPAADERHRARRLAEIDYLMELWQPARYALLQVGRRLLDREHRLDRHLHPSSAQGIVFAHLAHPYLPSNCLAATAADLSSRSRPMPNSHPTQISLTPAPHPVSALTR